MPFCSPLFIRQINEIVQPDKERGENEQNREEHRVFFRERELFLPCGNQSELCQRQNHRGQKQDEKERLSGEERQILHDSRESDELARLTVVQYQVVPVENRGIQDVVAGGDDEEAREDYPRARQLLPPEHQREDQRPRDLDEHEREEIRSARRPAKTHIFIQSMVPELTELSFYYMNLVTVSRLQRNPTVKSEIQMRNFETSIPVGFFCYPISQAADITAFKATTVPAGEDQKPMIEQCCEIVHKFNSVYGDTLVEPEIVLPQNAACLRLPGIDGKAKMSKSLGNCIYLSEEPEDIKKKVMSMYTDPNHLRVQDPGQVEGNPVFIYLDAFCRPEHFAEFWPEYQNLDEVKAHYQRGGLGDVKVKKFLNSVMQAELEPIRTRRKEWEQRLPEVVEILKEGSAYAEKTAAATLADVRRSMRIDYFDNDNLLK